MADQQPSAGARAAPDPGLDSGHPVRHEQPADWGWHAEFGKWARIGGWVSAAALILFNFTTRYSRTEAIWLWGFAVSIVALLILDAYRRRNAWRS